MPTPLGVALRTGCAARLFESLAEFHFQAEDAVLVAQPDDGYVIADRPLELDDAVLGGGGIGDVGQHEVARHLLLDGDAGAGAVAGRPDVGIDLDAANPEQSLNAAGVPTGQRDQYNRPQMEKGLLPAPSPYVN